MSIKVRELMFKDGSSEKSSNSLKLAMLTFDEALFNQTYNNLISYTSFRKIFTEIFLPFLNEIGVLWQVNSITPAHEHFITNLIKQKIHINIEKLQLVETKDNADTFVLFLPMNEIHELGLLYLHFELLLSGYHSVYLGQSVPIENLIDLQKVYKNICFVTYLTVEPSKESVKTYLQKIDTKVLKKTNDLLWVLGAKTEQIDESAIISNQIKVFKSPLQMLNNL